MGSKEKRLRWQNLELQSWLRSSGGYYPAAAAGSSEGGQWSVSAGAMVLESSKPARNTKSLLHSPAFQSLLASAWTELNIKSTCEGKRWFPEIQCQHLRAGRERAWSWETVEYLVYLCIGCIIYSSGGTQWLDGSLFVYYQTLITITLIHSFIWDYKVGKVFDKICHDIPPCRPDGEIGNALSRCSLDGKLFGWCNVQMNACSVDEWFDVHLLQSFWWLGFCPWPGTI